jgi:catechol 2,3-dioxygenase-like lactoylglutathione lyase family enzyme
MNQSPQANTMTDFNDKGAKVLSPSILAHVVLRTASLELMQDFYTTFLGGRVTHKNDMLSFMTYDHEHHRIALVGIPTTAPKNRHSCGLEHIAFTFPDLSSLLLAYRQRKARGIEPVWCVNHGVTTSLYYNDPDGNMLETQVENLASTEEVTEYLHSSAFAENPIGADFDPEELIRRVEAGEDDASLKKRPDVGPRGVPENMM